MTKKHYEAIAAIILQVGGRYNDSLIRKDILASVLADYFASENPRFDRARFLAACGIYESQT